MADETAMVAKLLRQQAAIAAFGTFALREPDLSAILNEATRVCAQALRVGFSKVCRYRPQTNDLLIEAGFGWNPGVVGFVVAHPDGRTPQGLAFSTGQPVICDVVGAGDRFELPAFYAEHAIVSTIDVVITGDGRPYGVLEIDNTEQYDYDQHDVNFVTSFANVLGESVATAKRVTALAEAFAEMKTLVAEKSRLLEQRKILAEELQHRVRNNLQLVYGMLSKQMNDLTDEPSRRGISAIARRVLTLAQVYDQLVGSELARTIDFSVYLKSLCDNLMEVQGSTSRAISLELTCDPTMLDLDVVTSLGIIVTELVTNSFEHAFPGGAGVILIALHNETDAAAALLTIRDDGPGFHPEIGSKRHGLGLVRRLSEQIGGTASVEIDHGTIWTIRFPIEIR